MFYAANTSFNVLCFLFKMINIGRVATQFIFSKSQSTVVMNIKSWSTVPVVFKIELKRCIQEKRMFSLSVTCRCTWTDSSDDDKIVKYLWEEMSGPLQDHTLQDDRNMLTLKDLVPGNYIFKWVHPIYADRLIAGLQSVLTKLNVELCWKTDCRVIQRNWF